MKVVSGFFIALLIGTQANASTYRCAVEHNEDYSVEINLSSKKAAFFDNNEWSYANQDHIGDGSAAYFSGNESSGAIVAIKMDLTEAQQPAQQSFIRLIDGDVIVAFKLDCSYATELASGI